MPAAKVNASRRTHARGRGTQHKLDTAKGGAVENVHSYSTAPPPARGAWLILIAKDYRELRGR